MGNGTSGARHMAKLNRAIDEQLLKDAKKEKRTIKLLLLGPAECGKSTVLKQMRILHAEGFSESEYEQQRSIIFDNIVHGILTILHAMPTFSIRFADQQSEIDAGLVHKFDSTNDFTWPSLPVDLSAAIQRLWRDSAVLTCFEHRSAYNLPDSTKYFLDELERISQSGYRPTEQDMLRSRVPTTGIVEISFEVKHFKFRVFDVGGQRSERKKWIHCFDSVKAIIFIVALSEYDQNLYEDGRTNRMHESMALFDSIVNCLYFVSTNFILFLNKKDLFEQKISIVPISIAFPEYTGLSTYVDSVNYIRRSFVSLNKASETREIYVHETCSTDSDQVQVVLDSTLDTIVGKALVKSGLY